MGKILKKMNVLLDGRQKAKMAGIVVLMFIGALLEACSIGLIIPLLTMLLNPEEVTGDGYLGQIYRFLGMESPSQFTILMLILIIAAFALKNLFLFIQNVVQLRFVYTNQFATSRRMMINFMERPYEYYLNADTSVIQRSITSDVNNMYGLILSCLQLVSEVIMFTILVIVLMTQDPLMIFAIALLLVAVLLLIKNVLKPIMKKAGEENQDYYSGLYKWIDQAVMGIKEIKIANRENYFINEYAKCGEGYVGAVQKYNIFNSTPRLLIETVTIAGLVLYLIFQILAGKEMTEMITQIGVFAVAAMRLLPSANRINNYLTSISYFEPFFMGVSDNLQEEINDGSVNYDASAYLNRPSVEKLPVEKYYSGLYKWIDQAVMGIKEIKIANRENYFINEYAKCGEGYVGAVQKYNIFNSTPRLLIETVTIAGLVLYLIFQILAGKEMTEMITQIGVFAVAAMRLLPSANRINNYLTSISYFEPFFMGVSDNLQEEINDGSVNYDASAYLNRPSVEKLPVEKKIELKNIVYKYPNTETLIFDHAEMEIPVGSSVGVVGSSGSGKTTIIDILLGLLKLQEGEILADGVEVREHYPEWLKNIGYIPQTIFMIDSTIRKNVAFGVPDEEIDDGKVWQALREAQLDEFVRSLPDGLDTSIGERGIRISGGQRQRIGIARALFEDPEVLVLDEATSALDNETEAAIMDSINRLHGRKTLIIIAHRLQTIEKCDMVYRVENGRIGRER